MRRECSLSNELLYMYHINYFISKYQYDELMLEIKVMITINRYS